VRATLGLQNGLRAGQTPKVLDYFIKAGAELLETTPKGEKLLDLAVVGYHDDEALLATLQFLQQHGVDIHENLKSGPTPLHFLCAQSVPPPLTIAYLARDAKAAMIPDAFGFTPVHLVAAYAKNPVAALRELQAQGADLQHMDPNRNLPMHHLVGKLPNPVVQTLLLELVNNDNANIPDGKGYTVLQRTVRLPMEKAELARLVSALVERGANPFLLDPSDKTPEQVLADRGMFKPPTLPPAVPLDAKNLPRSHEEINNDMWQAVIRGNDSKLRNAIKAGADKSLKLGEIRVYRVAKFLSHQAPSPARTIICETLIEYGFSKERPRPKAMSRAVAAVQDSPLYLEIALQRKPADFKKLNAHYDAFESVLGDERLTVTRKALNLDKRREITLSRSAEQALTAQANLLPHIVALLHKETDSTKVKYLSAAVLQGDDALFTKLLAQTSNSRVHQVLAEVAAHGSLAMLQPLIERMKVQYIDSLNNGLTALATLMQRPAATFDNLAQVKQALHMSPTVCKSKDKLAMIKILVSKGANMYRVFESCKPLDEMIAEQYPDEVEAIQQLQPPKES
jgi:hypothetical protein